MKTVLRGILALVLGLIVGSGVNMALVLLGHQVIAPPPGVNLRDPNSMSASMHLFEPRHFVFPFLAHALGSLSGAAVGFLVAAKSRALISYLIGALFLAGGIAAAFMIPAPGWFIAADLVLAYIPMAWLGTLIGRKLSREPAQVH